MSIQCKINKLILKADTFYKSDNLHKCIQLYKEVLKLEKDNYIALITISDCFIKMTLHNEAKDYALKAYQLYNEDCDTTTVNYSCILINCKNYIEAIEILEKGKLKNSIDYLLFNNLGYCYFLTDHYANALENYNISLILKENNPLAYCNRGVLKYFIFNDEDGINDLKKANSYGDLEAGMILQNIVMVKSILT